MAAINTNPIFSKASDVQISGPIITAASVVHDGSGTIATDVYKVFSADATNGGYCEKLIFKYVANATTTSVAAMLKIYIASVTSGATTNSNMALIGEIALPTTGTLSTTVVAATYEYPIGFAIPAGYSICCKITVAQSANTGWMCTAVAGKY